MNKPIKKPTIREKSIELEKLIYSPYAAFSDKSGGRRDIEEAVPPAEDLRTDYQRDRDRVIHCKAFRRLKQKTQVFLSPQGDHYRTRLTHTLEVAQIARTIARALRLNEDLTEAVALAHDLGHTPFGHAGERALNDLLPGGFRHYEQSVRVVERLEKEGRGLNLTYEVRDGIQCHTSGRQAETMEGKLIRLADKIAYINHDIDDAIRAGMLSEKEIPTEITDVLGTTKNQRITTLVCSVVENSPRDQVKMDPIIYEAYTALHEFMFKSVYLNDYAKSEEKKVPYIIERLYGYFLDSSRLPDYMRRIAAEEGAETAAADYISGMTDQYAIEYYKELFIPKAWNITLDTSNLSSDQEL